MKKSDILLTTLAVVLFIAPFVCIGVQKGSSEEPMLAGFLNTIKIVIIENPNLSKKNVHVKLDESVGKIFYRGNKQYAPEHQLRNDTLYIKSINNLQDENEDLYIYAKKINSIILNNEELYFR